MYSPFLWVSSASPHYDAKKALLPVPPSGEETQSMEVSQPAQHHRVCEGYSQVLIAVLCAFRDHTSNSGPQTQLMDLEHCSSTQLWRRQHL